MIKSVLVTGGGRGIGREIAITFAKAGHDVMICARSEKELAATAKESDKIKYVVSDLSADEGPQAAVRATIQAFERLDVVITCAGIYGPMGRFDTQDLKQWKETIKTNLFGTIGCVHAALPKLLKTKGSIICIAGAGVPSPLPNLSAYSVSKAGIVQFVTGIAKEYPEIQCNTVAPGAVATRLVDDVLAAGPEIVGKEFFEKNAAWKKGEQGVISASVAASFILDLVTNQRQVTGKYLSAVWDKDLSAPDPDMFTLKRIDGRNFRKA